jgi:hypothetical protein
MAALSTIAAIAGLGIAGVGLGKSLTAKTPRAPGLLPLPDAPVIDEMAEQREAEAARRRTPRRSVRRATVLTGPLGLTNEASVKRASLLGL